MAKSTHRVEVVPVQLEAHPNADRLSVVRVFGGYTVCVLTEEWQNQSLGAYIPPDSVVDTSRSEFAFLEGQARIKVKKLRGIVSMGLLMPVPNGAQIGDDLADYFGVTRYEPPLPAEANADTEAPPPGYHPNYDVDSLRRYTHVFEPGELVWATEKLHGANARFCYAGDRMYAGSKTTWKVPNRTNLWWQCLAKYPELEAFCQQHPEITVYGEIYGRVQNLRYGTEAGEIRLAVFDLLRESAWIDPAQARAIAPQLPWIPCVAQNVPFYAEAIFALAEGSSLIEGANHLREGIVVKPIRERTHPEIGRVCLKVVSNSYLEKA